MYIASVETPSIITTHLVSPPPTQNYLVAVRPHLAVALPYQTQRQHCTIPGSLIRRIYGSELTIECGTNTPPWPYLFPEPYQACYPPHPPAALSGNHGF